MTIDEQNKQNIKNLINENNRLKKQIARMDTSLRNQENKINNLINSLNQLSKIVNNIQKTYIRRN